VEGGVVGKGSKPGTCGPSQREKGHGKIKKSERGGMTRITEEKTRKSDIRPSCCSRGRGATNYAIWGKGTNASQKSAGGKGEQVVKVNKGKRKTISEGTERKKSASSDGKEKRHV